MPSNPLPLFAGVGVELEYMIVDSASLNVLPVSDEVLKAASGNYEGSVERGDIGWSNELVLHVIELKTNGPVKDFDGLAEKFQGEVREINRLLGPLGGRLMPTAMHPWMHPHRETRLWPHEYSPVYQAYDRIFGCQGHGWSNLQSVHLNLPFANDAEFARLHAAIRLVLPILPALAASSPIQDGRATGILDNRLNVYRTNSAKIPSITGRVIPEQVWSERDYDLEIMQRMYRDIAPHDPDGILQEPFLNSRGAIARFERNTIEIRVLDIQECPRADLAIASAILCVLRALVEERWCELELQQSFTTEALETIFLETVNKADGAEISDGQFLKAFGIDTQGVVKASDFWAQVLKPFRDGPLKAWKDELDVILTQGCLARRILRATRGDDSPERLRSVYGELTGCLEEGRMFAFR